MNEVSITVKWENAEQTALLWQFAGSYSWDDLQVAQQQSLTFVTSVSNDVDIIIDLSCGPGLPNGAFAKTKAYMRQTPPNARQIILVGANMLVRSFLQMYQKVFPATGIKFRFAATLEEARSLLPTH